MRLLVLLLLALNLYAERIIALSPAIAEILFAVGRGDEVVGVSDPTLYPKKAAALPKVGGYFQPNIETILALKPTLVIAQSNHALLLQRLRHLNIATQTVHLGHLDEIIQTIRHLGNNSKQAQRLIAAIETAKQRYTKTTPTPLRVLIVFGLFADLRENIYISGRGLFFDEIIELCGAVNAFTSAYPSQPILNYESLIALNPDVVIILQPNPNTSVPQALDVWHTLPIAAARNGRIVVIEEDFIAMPSHRVAQSIETLCQAIHD